MSIIAPIGQSQRQRVVEAVSAQLRLAEALFGHGFEPIPIVFDLTGRAAGMYQRSRKQRRIRFNPYIFAMDFEDNLENTVPHEVAHYVSDMLYGLGNIRPHGAEWQAIMHRFGAEASRTCSYDMTGVPVRSYRRFPYRCGCTDHLLTSRRHNRIERGAVRYFCRKCGETLRLGLEEGG